MKDDMRTMPCGSRPKKQILGFYDKKKRWLRTTLCLMLALVLLMGLTACGSASSPAARDESLMQNTGVGEAVASGAAGEGFADRGVISPTFDESSTAQNTGNSGTGAINQPPSAPGDLGRKLIRDGSADIETTEFEITVNGLYEMMKTIGGFLEAQTIQGGGLNYSTLRKASITVRVPSEKYDEAMFGLTKLGTVVRQTTNSTDITDQYTDTETRVRNLKIQETRILELIMKAMKLEEIVTLEGRLSDLRYQIESMENSLKNFDRLLEYSRITLQISEVVKVSDVKPVPKTLGQRISQAFDTAWTGFLEGSQDFAVWFVRNMFTLLILGIIILILWSMVRRGRRKRKAAKEERLRQHQGLVQPVGQGVYPMGTVNQAGPVNPNGSANTDQQQKNTSVDQ